MRLLKTLALAALFLVSSVSLAPSRADSAPFAEMPLDTSATSLPPFYAGHDIERWYGLVSGLRLDAPDNGESPEQFDRRVHASLSQSLPGAMNAGGRIFAFAVDIDAEPNLFREYDGGRLAVLFRMAFNQIAEGWSWDALADPGSADYYRYKYLLLKRGADFENGVRYTAEIFPGTRREVSRVWRYDYFLAFDNLYDFYERRVDDDAGFRAVIPMEPEEARRAADDIRLLAVARLKPPFHAESTTFWKATDASPRDYTLKKRYLFAELLEVWFYDSRSGKVLAKLQRRPA